jgi:hypothetical protein
MAARVRWRGTTAQRGPSTAARGYGRPHQAERERRLSAYRPGDRCAHGGERMWWWPLDIARRYLHLAHDHASGGYLPGLSCARHNIADRNLRRQGRVLPAQAWPASRQW